MARRFGWMSLAALAVLLVTGAWMATDRDLWSDSTLHAKLTLFVVAGGLILWHLKNGAAHWLQGAILLVSLVIVWLGVLAVNDDPYRMYIVIRRGAFTTLDEGGRMVGLAAVRAVRQFDMPDEWLRRAGKVVLRARQPSQFARLLEEPHAVRRGRRDRAPAAAALRALGDAAEDPGDVDGARGAAVLLDARRSSTRSTRTCR